MVSVMDSPALPGELFDQDGSGTGPPTHAVAEGGDGPEALTNLQRADVAPPAPWNACEGSISDRSTAVDPKRNRVPPPRAVRTGSTCADDSRDDDERASRVKHPPGWRRRHAAAVVISCDVVGCPVQGRTAGC